jgi:hypothetical protein
MSFDKHRSSSMLIAVEVGKQRVKFSVLVRVGGLGRGGAGGRFGAAVFCHNNGSCNSIYSSYKV